MRNACPVVEDYDPVVTAGYIADYYVRYTTAHVMHLVRRRGPSVDTRPDDNGPRYTNRF